MSSDWTEAELEEFAERELSEYLHAKWSTGKITKLAKYAEQVTAAWQLSREIKCRDGVHATWRSATRALEKRLKQTEQALSAAHARIAELEAQAAGERREQRLLVLMALSKEHELVCDECSEMIAHCKRAGEILSELEAIK